MFALTLAALLGPLSRLARTQDRFALAVADRQQPADLAAAGYFLTTVPFGPSDDLPPRTAVRRAGTLIAEAHTLSRIPFSALMAELGLRDAHSVAPLVIAWNEDPATALSVPYCEVRSVPVRPLGARWPWTIILTDAGDRGLLGHVEYPEWAEASDVTEFANTLETVLAAFVAEL